MMRHRLIGFVSESTSRIRRPAAHRRGWSGPVAWLLLSCLFLAFLSPALAGDGALDPAFDPGVGANTVPTLWGLTFYNDLSGKMMLTGSFAETGGYSRNGLARLNADGSVDPSFNAVINGYVNGCILLNPGLATSQMLICGEFSVPSSGGDFHGLARLNADGTVDTNFAHTFSTGEGVQTFGRQSDGKIVVGGYAMKVNAYTNQSFYLLRLNTDGTIDNNYFLRSGPGGYIAGMQTYPNTDPSYPNQVRLFGTIPRFSDSSHVDYMLLLGADGNTVMQSIGDEIVNGPILNLAFQGSNLVIAGAFTQVYGTPIGGVARLLSGGGLDPSFNKVGSGANGHVKRVTIDGNKLVLNGHFDSFNGTPCGHLVRLNFDGSVDGSFKAGTGADDRVWNTLRMSSDGSYLVLGAFQSFNGSPRQCLASIANDGSLQSRFASFTTAFPTSSAKVYAIRDSRQGLYIGGSMSGYGGKLHRRVARLNFDGTPDASYRGGMGGVVYSIRTQPDGKLLVAGRFGVGPGYESCTSLARLNLDGTLDPNFKPVVTKLDGTMPDIYMIEHLDNGQVAIAGDFAKIAGANRTMHLRSAFAVLNADGSLDPGFNAQITIPGASNITAYGGGNDVDNSKWLVAGSCLYQGSPAGFFTRLTSTGALDTTFGPPGGLAPHVYLFNGAVRTGTEQSDGKLILGGEFTQLIEGPQMGRLARFTVDGELDNTFSAVPGADGPVYSLQRERSNDRFFIGGSFTSYNGVARNNLARLNPNGSLDTSFDPGAGPNGAVYDVDYNDYIRKLRIGGAFTTYNGVSRPRVAQVLAGGSKGSPGSLLLLLED